MGEIVNLMAVDAQHVQDADAFQHYLWISPILIFVALYFIWRELGPSTLAGFAVTILLLPINSAIAAKVRKLQISQMRKKDERIKMTNEILNGIKVRVMNFFMYASLVKRLSETCKNVCMYVCIYIYILAEILMASALLKNFCLQLKAIFIH